MYKKLLVNEWFKEYSVIDVSEDCFNNSNDVETVGTMTAFKIHSLKNLSFRINELKKHNFREEK